ncbi:MAG: fibronectin type III domain-containing protein, partial [Gemmatimonadota bacterium]|nr:fibronectin type III domain-containing protein [Gemmatimonadota bacterium]
MKQKSVGLTLRALILALVLSLVAGTPALPPFEGVAYAQSSGLELTATAAPDGNSVSLSWNAVTDADSYEIWRGEVVNNVAQWGTSAYATVTGEDTTTYTDSSVTAGTTYAYAVRSVTDGTAASWSGPYPNVTIGGGTAAPTGVPTVTVAGGSTSTSVSVSWTMVTGATGYQIQYWHAGLDDWMLISGNQTSPYEHTGLTTGTQYYYVVRGVNAGGEGDWSSWRTDDSQITLVATSAVPTITLDHQSRTVVNVSWTESAAGSRYDLQRRRVVTATDPTQNPPTSAEVAANTTAFSRLPSSLLTDTSYTDSAANFVAPVDTTSAVHSVVYMYRVRAVDSADQEGDWSTVKSVTIPRSGAVLVAPTDLSVSVLSSSNLRVSWNNVAGADYYELQWKSGDRSYSTSITVNRPDSGNPSYNDTGLTPSTKYTYRVRGVDVNGPGDWSAEENGTTLSVTAEAGQMPKVTGLTVTDETSSNTADERKAKLTWNAVSNATHYELQRYDPSTTAGWQNLDATPADGVTRIDATSSPSHTDTFASGAAGKTYFYVVSAVEDGVDGIPGNADDEMGEWSDFKGVTFKAHKPNTAAAFLLFRPVDAQDA